MSENAFTLSVYLVDPINLEDVLPEKPEFTLLPFGDGAEIHCRLRICNLEDRVWIKNRFGGEEEIQRIFQERDWDKLAMLVYRLLEDKSPFKLIDKTGHDDVGQEITIRTTGPQSLMQAIKGVEEEVKVLGALTASIRLSSPLVDKHVREEVKKNIAQREGRTGEKSSTVSSVSTDGPSPTAAP